MDQRQLLVWVDCKWAVVRSLTQMAKKNSFLKPAIVGLKRLLRIVDNMKLYDRKLSFYCDMKVLRASVLFKKIDIKYYSLIRVFERGKNKLQLERNQFDEKSWLILCLCFVKLAKMLTLKNAFVRKIQLQCFC